MYGRKTESRPLPSSDKNPNRVAGGLRAQGADRLTIVAEDGSSQDLPSLAYVRSLEEKIKKQRAAIDILERKLSRQDTSIQQITAAISRRN
jgi:hypothetical protein